MRKKIFIISVVAIVIIAAGAVVFLNQSNQEVISEQTETEAEKIIKDNEGAIKNSSGQQLPSVRPIDETDHIWGNINASVKMIIYSDFECPFCADFVDTVKQVKAEFGDKIIIAFRHFPLERHDYAVLSAVASECAAEQEKFWEMHDKIFADNKAGRLNKEQFKKDAADLGLNEEQFNQCLDSEKYKDKILSHLAEGKNAGIIGTPTIFINNIIIPGAYPMDDFTDSQGRQREGLRKIINNYLN